MREKKKLKTFSKNKEQSFLIDFSFKFVLIFNIVLGMRNSALSTTRLPVSPCIRKIDCDEKNGEKIDI